MNDAKVIVVARALDGQCEIITMVGENNQRDRRNFISKASSQRLRQMARQFLKVADEADYGTS